MSIAPTRRRVLGQTNPPAADNSGNSLNFRPGIDYVAGVAGFTLEQLEAAFKLVRPATHWKDPIHAEIDCLTSDGHVDVFKLAAIAAAVEHYTATPAKILVDDWKATITADGYRRGPAGDH